MCCALPFARRLFVCAALAIVASLLSDGVARAQEEPAAPDAVAPDAAATEGAQPTQINAQELMEKSEAAIKEGDFQTALTNYDQLARAAEQQAAIDAYQI